MIYAGVSKLRSTAQQIADGSPIINGSTTIGYVAPIEAVLGKAGANGYYFDGVNDFSTLASVAATAVGLSDFAIYIAVAPADWTPSAARCLFSDVSGNNGVKINLTTAGLLQLQIGNGTNFTTYSYSSTTAVPTANDHVAWVGIEADRDGNVTFVWNGSQLGDAVDMSGSAAQTATGGTAYLMRDGSTYHQGRVYTFHLLNYCPDSATRLRYYMYGVPDSDKWGSFAASYTSDFSAGVASWVASAGTVAGNVDTIGGLDDNLRYYADGTSGTHAPLRTGVFTVGKRYRLTTSHFVPSGNTHLKGVRWVHTSDLSDVWFTLDTTADAWVHKSTERVANQTGIAAWGLTSGGSGFAGSNLVTDDLFYVRGVTITQLGCVICLDGGADATVNHYQWQDSSTNLLDWTVTGAAMLVPRARGRVRGTTNTNGNQQILGGTALPASNVIVKDVYMVAASGGPTVSVGSASADTQYVNGQTLSTSLGRPTQATPLLAPTANLWVASDGTMNVTTTVYYELPLV